MKTAVIYARYSSSNQTEQSIEGQIHVCEDYAKRNNIVIVDSYIDRAISGTTDERESFQRMLKDSNNRKWDYVLVYKLDRFARNQYESVIHKHHLKNNGVKLLSAMENISDTPEGMLLESFLEGMNQYFSEELAQKVNRGLHESRMKGHCIGSVPFGYIKENKKLKINEEEAFIIQRIYTEYANGKPILQISKDFEKQNITKNGQKFLPQTIRKMLQRDIYTGILNKHGKAYDKIYPQIISPELFAEVQVRMDKTRYGCRKDNHEIFKIKDKIFCGVCGKKMYPCSTRSHNGNPLRYYTCINTRKNNCANKRVHKGFIEKCIEKSIVGYFNVKENLNSLVNDVYTAYIKSVDNDNSLANLRKDLKRVNKSIENIMSAIEKGVVTTTTKSRLEELETKQIALHEKIIIEEAKEKYIFTKEDILKYFEYCTKCDVIDFDSFVKFVNVFKDKIEIGLNLMVSNNDEPVKIYLTTEHYSIERMYRGGHIRKTTYAYDIYLVI